MWYAWPLTGPTVRELKLFRPHFNKSLVKRWQYLEVLQLGFQNVCLWKKFQEVIQDFVFLDRAFSVMKIKVHQQNAQINSGLIYYWSITPTCFGPSVEAIIREFEILESYKAIVLIC